MAKITLQILFDNSVPEPNTGCLVWTGKLKGEIEQSGYAVHYGVGPVHRAVVRDLNGEDLSGKYACHRCGHSWCVEPTHLYAGTPKENTADAIRHGTFRRHLDVLAARDRELTPEEREAKMRPLREGLARVNAAIGAEARRAKAANGIAAIRERFATMTDAEQVVVRAKMARGSREWWASLDLTEKARFGRERALKSWESRRRNGTAKGLKLKPRVRRSVAVIPPE